MILKAYKFRMYPNANQQTLLSKTFGCTRFVYNYYLDKKIKFYSETNKKLSSKDCINDYRKSLKQKNSWLSEVNETVIENSILDLERAYNNLSRNKSIHYHPKYKSKFNKNSYKISNKNNCIKLNKKNNSVTLPVLGSVKIRGYRNLNDIEGRIINATISKDKINKYYIAILIEQIEVRNDNTNRIIGLDLGIKELITTSDGETYKNIKATYKYEKRINKLHRKLAKQIKGSENYNKTKLHLAILYSKTKNTRKYYMHGISKKITDENSIIVTEKLQIKNMVQNHNLAKSISDASWYEFLGQIEYKSKWKGHLFYQVDSFYPSSQECSVCGWRNKEVKNLSIREWICNNCSREHDRDVNAAVNIMYEGLKKYVDSLR